MSDRTADRIEVPESRRSSRPSMRRTKGSSSLSRFSRVVRVRAGTCLEARTSGPALPPVTAKAPFLLYSSSVSHRGDDSWRCASQSGSKSLRSRTEEEEKTDLLRENRLIFRALPAGC